MNTFIFEYTQDFMTSYNLAGYARYITGINGITVEFVEKSVSRSPMVDIKTKIIYLPMVNYADQFDIDLFRMTKAYLCHECAHLMFKDEKFYYPGECGNDYFRLRSLAGTIDDLRIENLFGRKITELRDDFKFLIECIWKKNYLHYADNTDMGYGRYGDFSLDMSGSLFWLLQKQYRGASLTPPAGCDKSLFFKTIEGMDRLFENELVPVLDNFVNTRKSSWDTAMRMLEILNLNGFLHNTSLV